MSRAEKAGRQMGKKTIEEARSSYVTANNQEQFLKGAMNEITDEWMSLVTKRLKKTKAKKTKRRKS